MVLEYSLNVLHLDADSVCGAPRPTARGSPRTAPLSRTFARGAQVWFANPYPLFKGVMAAFAEAARDVLEVGAAGSWKLEVRS